MVEKTGFITHRDNRPIFKLVIWVNLLTIYRMLAKKMKILRRVKKGSIRAALICWIKRAGKFSRPVRAVLRFAAPTSWVGVVSGQVSWLPLFLFSPAAALGVHLYFIAPAGWLRQGQFFTICAFSTTGSSQAQSGYPSMMFTTLNGVGRTLAGWRGHFA